MELKAIDWIRVKDFMPPDQERLIVVKGKFEIKIKGEYACLKEGCPKHKGEAVIHFYYIIDEIEYMDEGGIRIPLSDITVEFFSLRVTQHEKHEYHEPKEPFLYSLFSSNIKDYFEVDENEFIVPSLFFGVTHWAKL